MSATNGQTSPSIAAAASSIRSSERLAIATRAPSRASAAAIARPSPRLAPITSATRRSSPSSMPAFQPLRSRRDSPTPAPIELKAGRR